MIQRFLQGKSIGHPLHPLLVHFPIAFFTLSIVLDAGSIIAPAVSLLSAAAAYTLIIGVITAFVASVPGFVDFVTIREDHPGKRTAQTHMLLNLAAVGVYVVSLFVRFSASTFDRARGPAIAFSAIAYALIVVSGYLGGTLVYDDGIAVGRHRRWSRTPRVTLKADIRAGDSEFVEVADFARLKERETLRVELARQVIAVVKLDGNVYAFQEFCTHRFGPLSEGSFQNGIVQCPWHRSCFDVRAGKVVRGPAKVDLKTYPVRIENSKIFISLREAQQHAAAA
jgi:nitrite reductase/ring-hydroxylating ferredoxin subunit/uncharacterized membrane protein